MLGEVALIELRMMLLFTAREIDVECAWDEWDAMRLGRSPRAATGLIADATRRGKTDKPPSTLNGSRAYRTVVGLSSPKDDLPVHIRLRLPEA